MAPENPADGEVEPVEGAVLLDRLRGVMRAGGMEPAVVAGNQRGNETLIEPDKAYEDD